jgi:hypothetical protein
MGLIAAGIGAAALGTAASAYSAEQSKSAAKKAANLPGVNFGDIYSQSQTATNAAIPGAQNIVGQENNFNQDQLNAILERAIPGYSAMQARRSLNINNELKGVLPPDVESAIERAGAARSISGGFGGSGFGSNLTARDLGLTSLDLMGRGNNEAAGLITGTPHAGLSTLNGQLDISPSTALQERSSERGAQQQILAGAAAMPGWTGTLGAGLQSVGGIALGSGLRTGGTSGGVSYPAYTQPGYGGAA